MRATMAVVTPLRQPALPADIDGMLRLAAQSMFAHFADAAQGMLLLDREHRIVWINDGYKRFLPALGFAGEQEFVGRRIEEVKLVNTGGGAAAQRGRTPAAG